MPTLVGELRQNNARTFTDSKGKITYEEDRSYLLYADSITQSKDVLAQTSGLPQVNQTTIGSMICKSVNFERDQDKPTRWTVNCTFSSQVEEGTDPSTPQQGDPTAWIPYGEVTFEPWDEVLSKDLDGKAWVNTAGIPFEQGLINQRRIASVPFTQYEPLSTTNIDELMERSDSMNEKDFLGKEKYYFLIQVDNAKIGTYYGHRCWQVSYTIKYKPFPLNDEPSPGIKGGWHIHQLNAGYHYRTGGSTLVANQGYYTGGTLRAFEEDGLAHVGLLAANGDKLPDGNDPYWRVFRNNKYTDFNKFLRIRRF